MRYALLMLMLVAGPSGLLRASPAESQTFSDEEAVEAARQSLDGAADFPWYDAQNDRVQRIDVRPPKDLKNRHSKWETPPPPDWTMPAWFWKALEVLGWTLLAAVIAALVIFLVRAFLIDEVHSSASIELEQDTSHAGDAARIESLPFQIKHSQSDLLGEARRCYEAGDFGQAIIYLYSYQLVQLDKYQVIRLAQGKTNRQYLREVRPRPSLFELLERTMTAFEEVFFGRHRLERKRFESCWSRLDDFHQQLEQAAS